MPKGIQLRLLQKQLHTHVYRATIHNSQAMETAKMPHYTNEWTKKMWYLFSVEFYSATEILPVFLLMPSAVLGANPVYPTAFCCCVSLDSSLRQLLSSPS
jgi:hypothetical protein